MEAPFPDRSISECLPLKLWAGGSGRKDLSKGDTRKNSCVPEVGEPELPIELSIHLRSLRAGLFWAPTRHDIQVVRREGAIHVKA